MANFDMERGYQQSSLEAQFEKVLKALNINYVRQFPSRLGFVIDFAIPSKKLGFEVDGPYHIRKRDAFRDKRLRREGWTIIRIHYSELQDEKALVGRIKELV
jgi:very-short-patch-repair endonuclease